MMPKINAELFNRPRTPPPEKPIAPKPANETPTGLIQLDPSKLLPFSGQHPFKPYSPQKLNELAVSIERNGVISPIIIRPKGDIYEIISGHNRVSAAKIISLPVVPCLIHDVDDDTALLELIASNLAVREFLFPSEKAWAYKLQYEALQRHNHRGKSVVGQVDPQPRNSTIMSQNSEDSEKQIRRYIALTRLIPHLLELVDNGEMPFMAGVNTASLNAENQQLVLDFLTGRNIKLDIKTSEQIKHLQENHNVTLKTLEDVFTPKPPPTPKVVKIRYNRIKSYIREEKSAKEIEDIIIKALQQYYESGGN
ncbi:MAG: ParB N-terminal domain-containing protein [Oscillospiraceae bacterium]